MRPTSFDMSGKNVLITGGGTGLGQQFARDLAAAGASVILSGRRLDKLEATAAEIRDSGGTACCVAMDVADSVSVEQAFRRVAEIGQLNVLLNNAGTTCDKMLLDVAEAEWDGVMDINLKGAWLVARAAARAMIEQQSGGSIVNIASILGNAVQKGTAPYAATKAALIQLTRVMALEWARYGIRVNAIAPGYYLTDMAADFLTSEVGARMIKRIPMRRTGEAHELGGALLLLASDASSYMTGSMITVDGGLSLPVI